MSGGRRNPEDPVPYCICGYLHRYGNTLIFCFEKNDFFQKLSSSYYNPENLFIQIPVCGRYTEGDLWFPIALAFLKNADTIPQGF